MPIIDTSTLKQGVYSSDSEYIYNALDCCVTMEVFEEVSTLYNTPPDIYNFSRALQAPVLEMMCRGFRVDEYERRAAITDIRALIETLERQLQIMAHAVWDRGLNPRSPKQLLEFFYGKMKLPEIWSSQKGVKKLSMNMETLEKLEVYLHARPIIAHIMRIRELSKMLSVLETEIDSDGRMRTSYNIGGTESGRFSSSANAFGTGTNLQNLRQDPDWKLEDGRYKISLRKIFVADPGYKICGIDLEQAESREVGLQLGILFDDWKYLDYCECLTADHEVLTPDGWQSISLKPEKIVIWENDILRMESPLKWNEGKTNKLIQVESQTISLLATPNHSMPVYQQRTNKLIKKTVQDLKWKTNTAPLTGKYNSGVEYIPNIELLAAFQADGTRDSQGRVHFSFTKERKILRMRKLLIDLNLDFSEYNLGSGATRFYIKMGQGQEHWNKVCGKEILTWDSSTLAAFCDSHKYWDGSFDVSNCRITAKNKHHIEWLATAYTLNGDVVNITPHKEYYWNLTIRERKTTQYRSAMFYDITPKEPVSVYCPTVSSGFFLVRRNNKIFISGNSGDLHTETCKLIWGNLPWTGDKKKDRAIAEQNFYRQFSYRDMSKRGSHGSNYMGTPFTMARHLKVPTKLMENFQTAYFRAYPIPHWHTWTAGQIQTIQQLTTPFGRRRHFFGRPNDDTTLREAVAYVPQSATADRMNLALWRMWQYMGTRIQLLAQVHDAVYFQFPETSNANDIISEALTYLRTPLKHTRPNGEIRVFDVPGEAKVGWNWGNYHEKYNPDGLMKWKGQDDRKRSGSGLQRVM